MASFFYSFVVFTAAILSQGHAGPPTKLPVVSDHPSGHRRLADPIESMKGHYEFLVIGSGYGASVAALRIAEALKSQEPGKKTDGSLAILERGREWLPGEFPESLPELAGAVRSPLNPLGLVNNNTSMQASMDVIGASALGGTSILNAAITERPPANVWSLPRWPVEIRDDFKSGVLEQDFQAAECMLCPNLGPKTKDLPKSREHLQNFPPNFPKGQLTLNVNHEPGRERHGVVQKACTNCGNCCGGCNVGAKNTLTTNYLPAAKNLGAQIFTQIEIQSITKLPPGGPRYRINYVIFSKDKLGLIHSKPGSVTADNIFLGAGSAGSTEILMRSRSESFKMSDRLGTGVSANGDVLGFVYNAKPRTNIAARLDSKSTREGPNPVGQTITVYADFRKHNERMPIEYQFLLLDGSVPTPFVQAGARVMGAAIGPSFVTSFSGSSRIWKDLGSPVPPQDGALNHSMVLLACGHDSCSGRYVLDSDGKVSVDWPNMQDETSFKYINKEMKAYAERMGGKFIANPRSSFFGGNKMQATHPLGGAPMGDSVASGVVNHLGQVFNPDGGVHEGLYVVDASVLPHSLAAPPLITITALAERSLRRFVARYFGGGCAIQDSVKLVLKTNGVPR